MRSTTHPKRSNKLTRQQQMANPTLQSIHQAASKKTTMGRKRTTATKRKKKTNNYHHLPRRINPSSKVPRRTCPPKLKKK